MRIATIHGRVALIDGTRSGAVDVETASRGRLGFGIQSGISARDTSCPALRFSAPLARAVSTRTCRISLEAIP